MDSLALQKCFPAINGFGIRADFNGGVMSSDRALLVRGIDN